MERRKAIYDNIKSSKLNKLTIKQGDINVQLNLKQDLLDEKVQIPDKVLSMLETYAKKTIGQSKNITENNFLNTQARSDNQIESKLTPLKSNSGARKLAESPSKRVRFDLAENPTQVTNESDNGEEEPARDQQIGHVELEKEFLCRLCGLKFPLERSLHEHVTRIHGGKSIINRVSKSGEMIEESQYDEEADDGDDYSLYSNDEDEDDSDYLSSCSDTNKKSKRTKAQAASRPNVAIRVAKVAYYNNKNNSSNNTNSTNLFKSNIFKNGGIRGNFFSQERLPLRSCKIKLKLTCQKELVDKDKDEFLVCTNEITKLDHIDSNTTISIQDAVNNEDMLSTGQIKAFFKSLLDYIPINSVTRLDDLIKSSENDLCQLNTEFDSELNVIGLIRFIHESILDSKQFGLTLHELYKKILFQFKLEKIKMGLVKRLLSVLLRNHNILSVGVVERVYVAHEFKRHWVIESLKNSKGRREKRNSSIKSNDQQSSTDQSEQENNEIAQRLSEDHFIKSKQFRQVCLIPRPWRYIDGLLNRPVLKKMLESILSYLKSYPHSTFNSISSHFCPVLQPIMTLELLEMLEQLKCVRKCVLSKENDCDLFSDFNNGSKIVLSENDQIGNEIFTYFCSQNSIFILKKVFPSSD
jgi:hypothetical protein